MLCAVNRLQWHLLYQRWQGIVRTLRDFIGGEDGLPTLSHMTMNLGLLNVQIY